MSQEFNEKLIECLVKTTIFLEFSDIQQEDFTTFYAYASSMRGLIEELHK